MLTFLACSTLAMFIYLFLLSMSNLEATNTEIKKLGDALAELSASHDKTVQATRATDDRFVELSEKIDNIDEDVLDGTVCCSFVTNEIEKAVPDDNEDYVDKKIGELEERIESVENKLETIGSAFRCLGSDIE